MFISRFQLWWICGSSGFEMAFSHLIGGIRKKINGYLIMPDMAVGVRDFGPFPGHFPSYSVTLCQGEKSLRQKPTHSVIIAATQI